MKEYVLPVGALGAALLLIGVLIYERAYEATVPPPAPSHEHVGDTCEGLSGANGQRWMWNQPRHLRDVMLRP